MKLKQWLHRLWGVVPADPVDSVSTDYDGFTFRLGAESSRIPWSDVATISIQHVGESVNPDRIHYILELPGRMLRVSLATPGMNEFVRRLQTAPGLDHDAYKNAIGVLWDKPMPIWRNPEKAQQSR